MYNLGDGRDNISGDGTLTPGRTFHISRRLGDKSLNPARFFKFF